MRIGIDFDNTIANYDGVFHAAAVELGLIPPQIGQDKNSVRDHLNESGRKDDFTRLQGYIYGARMDLVSPYTGVTEFVREAVALGHEVFVVSHKTKTPIMGPAYDMHAAARGFLETYGFFEPGMLAQEHTFFALTKEEKVAQIAALKIDAFIDDLPDILRMPGFPSNVRPFLFDPHDTLADKANGLERVTNWGAIREVLLAPPSTASSPRPDEATLLAQATALCATAGRGRPRTIAPLSGGKNNRVYRLETDDGPLVLKCYFQHTHDRRDRLGNEWDFLNYAWARGVRCVPEPLACDRAAQLGLYEFNWGDKLPANGITEDHVQATADFVVALNQHPQGGARNLKPGSEACFSIADHLERVDRRIGRLATLDPEAPHAEVARTLVNGLLAPRWQVLKDRILAECAVEGLDPDTHLPEAEVIVSPSDFGFHNILCQGGQRLVFLDFEYAGRDDPAKLAGDFFACPEIPTPPEHFDLFVETLCRQLHLSDAAHTRMYMLRDVYHIKWACIVLNDFLPHHDARRHFSNQDDRKLRCAAQIDKANALISRTASN